MALIFLILVAVVAGVGVGAFAVLAVWLGLLFMLLDALVQQVPRGVMLFVRLATWLTVRSAKVCRYVWVHAKRGGLWAAQHAYVWLFVWSFRLREWYVSSEIRRRDAH